jgi:hypothetical protein
MTFNYTDGRHHFVRYCLSNTGTRVLLEAALRRILPVW